MGGKRIIYEEGTKIHKWTVLREVPCPEHRTSNKSRRYYLCRCKCGTERAINTSDLKSGHTKGCAKCHGRVFARSSIKHGDSSRKDPQYKRLLRTWYGMLSRCHSSHPSAVEKNKNYKDKGIFVCDEWQHIDTGYLSFRSWALANGYENHLTIDRKDPNGPYSPENCQWATLTEQARNKSNTIWVEVAPGHKLCIADAIKHFNNNIRPSVVYRRIFRGWDLLDAVSKPISRPNAAISAAKNVINTDGMDNWQALEVLGEIIKTHRLNDVELKALQIIQASFLRG